MSTKSKLDSISKETLAQYMESSSSLEEVCHKIGYKQINKDLPQRLVKLCNEYDIDVSILLIERRTKKCQSCGLEKDIKTDFYWSNGKTRTICKDCVRKSQNEKYHSRQIELNKLKEQRGCAKCGNTKYYLLDFHHRDPSKKDFSISDNTNAKIDTLMKEIEKCVCLCANCHREFHFLERENGLTIDEYLEQ